MIDRRPIVARSGGAWAILLLLLAAANGLPVTAALSPPAATAGAGAPVTAVASVGFTVAEMDRSVRFFTEVLGFEKVADVEVADPDYERLFGLFGSRLRVVTLRLGSESLELTEYLAPRGRPIPSDSRSNDRWFQHIAIVVSDMDRAYALLRMHRVEYASSGPQRLPDWNPGAAGIQAFYFRDPDGHNLEVIAFPAGKGDPRWRHAGDRLFLGIDHTAIVVKDTEASLRIYRDLLGLRVAGESENYGVEQEHLNNVFGARLRITGLRAPVGPGIEFLEYLAPGDGREYPLDSKASDLWHWQTRLVAADPGATARSLKAAGLPWISPGAVATPRRELGFPGAALVRDPDGHALLVTPN